MKSALSDANVTYRRRDLAEDNRASAQPRFTAVYRNLFLHQTHSPARGVVLSVSEAY